MARKPKVNLTGSMEEGYPVCNRHDGIDLTLPLGGYQNDALVVETPVERYVNSNTGLPTSAPEYTLSNPHSRSRRKGSY